MTNEEKLAEIEAEKNALARKYLEKEVEWQHLKRVIFSEKVGLADGKASLTPHGSKYEKISKA